MKNHFNPLLPVELPITTPKIRRINMTDFENILAEVNAEKALTFAWLASIDFAQYTQEDFDVEL